MGFSTSKSKEWDGISGVLTQTETPFSRLLSLFFVIYKREYKNPNIEETIFFYQYERGLNIHRRTGGCSDDGNDGSLNGPPTQLFIVLFHPLFVVVF